MSDAPFPYKGPPEWEALIAAALARVVDPEVALSIVDLGLIYSVHVTDELARVHMTMTSAACPVTELIADDVESELDRVLPSSCAIEVDIGWEPPWTPARMSERARRVMRW